MTVWLARSGAWLALQAASLPDTIVTIQAQTKPSWFQTVSSLASIAISIALLALAVGLIPAAWNFRKSYKKANDLLDRVYADVTPLVRHAHTVADNLDYITTAIRVAPDLRVSERTARTWASVSSGRRWSAMPPSSPCRKRSSRSASMRVIAP